MAEAVILEGAMFEGADDTVGEVRSRISIEDLVRDYNVTLLPSGGKRLRALCPFHNEKTPSFYVNLEKQFYHCFGCKEHGDIFTFVEKMDHVGFAEALEILARKAGVPLRRRSEQWGGGGKSGDKVALFDALALAEEFYHRILLEDPRGAAARRYLEGRRIRAEMWKRFRLGYSPPEWEGLIRFAATRGVSVETLEKAGLARAREAEARSGDRGGRYDYFRGRLMFPIQDPQKRVIGFGARALDAEVPKYLNSPRTALFEKDKVLYGLPQAAAAIQRRGRVAIMEGYTDAIMAHQEGLEHALASLGTAFTSENARRLKRLLSGSGAQRVDLVFDGDAAGQSATERSLDLLVAEDLDVRIYTVTDGKDPCDAVIALGGEEFARRVDAEAVDVFEFKWRRTVAAAEARGDGPAGVARALDEVLTLLSRVPNVVARKLHLKRLSERLDLDEADVGARLSARMAAGAAVAPEKGRSGPLPRSGSLESGQPQSGQPQSGQPQSGQLGERPSERGSRGSPALGPTVEEVLLECLLAEPEKARERLLALGERSLGERFAPGGRLRSIAVALERQLSEGRAAPSSDLARGLLAGTGDEAARDALLSILARLDGEPEGARLGRDEVWKNCLRELDRKALESRRRALEAAQARAREENDRTAYLALQREELELLRILKSPRSPEPGQVDAGKTGGADGGMEKEGRAGRDALPQAEMAQTETAGVRNEPDSFRGEVLGGGAEKGMSW